MCAAVAVNPLRSKYQKLVGHLTEISHLQGVLGLLEWDQQVMMPSGAASCRESQSSILTGILHDKKTNQELGDIISELDQSLEENVFNEWEKANIRDAKRAWDKEIKIPKRLAQRLSELSSRGYAAWTEARDRNQFSVFAPVLEDWVKALKEKANYIDPNRPVYDVLLDDFERGLTSDRLEQLFGDLKESLIPLVKKIKEKNWQPSAEFLTKNEFPVDPQVEFSHSVARDIGFDMKCGRLDVSIHPFTGGAHPTDVRMTTRYSATNLLSGLGGTIHETGHSLYEQARNKDYENLPVSEALSMGIHESQSLLWERMVGQSLPFWEHYFSKLAKLFPEQLKDVSPKDLYLAYNTVKPDYIRVEADEVTYPLHIAIRYEIEKDLVEGKIKVTDLPAIWNRKYEEYLGIPPPPTDTLGVLQDVHWSAGLVGYFPTYTLGAIYAVQFFRQAEKEVPQLTEEIRNGNFAPLKEWLNKSIHVKGSLIPSGDELAVSVTGEPLNAKLFGEYLVDKYSTIYNL
ncbi:M32 carboxypeptidase Taq metallopeptidase peptidase [Basidiobolus meristosporus CBS 931.73]|uniref:M32 carboxypeptidase Taq metallopeptidase peptidase n=1 Tax=Basidiobolus meristosporus CBS 931.73 TaxID=1314790 RepID=A0A1Y1Y1V8_9FUNG|nr:M32 carboxypeptidase Taq metallopeptidase peptidase [Basidiobolus meristosporus CBS 931.73]|eukprot:ORX91968.1 M32 carboxypeptidase Taq metallopeptidase peptidase [Basidiobolus meristosporus CBS 931.73]